MSAYAGKSLHVAIEAGEMEPYAIFTNDGDDPIARCVDRGTAHLFAAAPALVEALEKIIAEVSAAKIRPEVMQSVKNMATNALTKAGV